MNSSQQFPNPDERGFLESSIGTETDTSPPRGNPFPIVGIGASAGGLEAFGQLLSSVPTGTGIAFVLVQHLDPQHESLLAELLGSNTSMPVVTVRDGTRVEPNRVYVIPPNSSMELQDGHLRLALREPGLHLPIDIFFRSLAKVQGSKAIGIVLSGNASDGSLGLRAIKAECGITFAQDESTARFSGMPRNAIATGAVDYILPPKAIGEELGRIGGHPYLVSPKAGDSKSEVLPEGDRELHRIFSLLHAATKVDFSHYKPTTIRRRIGRRMMVLRMQGLSEYARFAELNPPELRELYRDLLISVTSFFRDPETFEALKIFLAERIGDDQQSIRIWVPGCATGEEVYSMAICVYEVLQEKQLTLPMQLFGTDISDLALTKARQGLYPGGIAEDVSDERLRRFFLKVDSGYQVTKPIRESCIFARHDVTVDPPFSNLDIVSCRNLLIYLDQTAQKGVLPAFHYALRPNGLLVLGSAETTAAAPDLFIPSGKQRIYQRKDTPTRISLGTGLHSKATEATPADISSHRSSGIEVQKKLERVIQSRYSPDAVVVNSEMHILQFRGHTSAYLDPAPGEASLNVLRMAKEALLLPLRRCIQAASESNTTVRDSGIPLEIEERREEIALEVTPIAGANPAERIFLIVFSRTRPDPAFVDADRTSPSADERVRLLQREVAEVREYLRTLTEEYEANSEELRAANEEARSANEELQSANEELGTTKEELQSANEELTTVNEEMQNRNGELSATNGDLKNLLSAVTVAIVMVDSDLRVRRFNHAAGKLLELGPLDIGRPVGHIRGRVPTPKLEEQVKIVIESLHATSDELQDSDGRWHSVSVRAYRTLDDRIAGAVITFQDIDPLKRGLQSAEEARDYAESMIETVREPLVVLDSDFRVQRATAAFYETFLVSREETQGRYIYDLGSGQWNRPRLRELLGAALFKSQPFHDFEVQHDFPHIGMRTMRLNGRRIPRSEPQHRTLLLSIEDVTERREIAEIRFRRLFETAKDGIVVVDVETGSVLDVNPYLLELTGYGREDFVGKGISDAGKVVGISEAGKVVPESKTSEIVRYENLQVIRSDGKTVSVEVVGNRYYVGSQQVVQLNVRDISARQLAAAALRESEERFRHFVESVHDYALFQLDRNGSILSWNSGAERLLGWKESEVAGKHAAIVFTPEDIAAGAPQQEIETAACNGRAEDERWHLRKDGSRFFASGVLTQLRDENDTLLGFAKVMRDITARKDYEEQLQRSLEEKSMLVREIHHRVKNNLQVIVSLLSLQSGYTNDARVMAAFEETEGRVRAIAQIHERLYASDDLTEVEFGSYLTNLTRELLALHGTARAIELETHVAEMVLDIEQAIPLGLIANELIVNSLKHGLKNGPGRLVVTLEYRTDRIQEEGATLDDGWARVRVADSGPGLPQTLEFSQTKSMGFRLVHLLVRQLRGTFEHHQGPGANITVSFPLRQK